MKALTFAEVLLKATLKARRIDPIHIFAWGCLVVGSSIWLWLIPALRHQLTSIQMEVQRLTGQLDSLSTTTRADESGPSLHHLQEFYQTLGQTRYAEQQVATVIALANKNGLTIAQTDYRLVQNTDGGFRTYTVSIPIQGEYQMVRRFCHEMLLAIPFAALDEIDFKRVSISSATIETHAHFTLFLDEPDRANDVLRSGQSALKHPEGKPPPAATIGKLLPRAQERLSPANESAIFGRQNWTPAPQVIAAPAPPPVTAPVLPFNYAGKRLVDGEWEVFLARGDRLIYVRNQMVVDTVYRIDSILPPTLIMTYLPLKQRQVLTIGAVE